MKEKVKDLNTLITTKGGHNYYFSRSVPQILLTHPILKHLMELKLKGTLKDWFGRLKSNKCDSVLITDSLYAQKKDIYYYYEYLKFLEKHKYFNGVNKVDMPPNFFNENTVKRSLANTQQIVFEVTESCNLSCKYCGYGDMYQNHGNRSNRSLDFELARNTLDYMVHLFESPLNRRHYKKISISFYGGEPLLNMPFIVEILRFSKNKKMLHKEFQYTMTTNGILLDKYMDYLARPYPKKGNF